MLGVGTQLVNRGLANSRQFLMSAEPHPVLNSLFEKVDRGRILHRLPRFSAENITANVPMVDLIRQCAEKKNAPRLKFRWLGRSQENHSLFRSPAHATSIT